MNRALLHVAALALPLLGLGAGWLRTDRASREGVEWEVPVQGYDPRDFLQGHYVMFQYDWPGLEFDAVGPFQALCVEGQAPRVDRVRLKTEQCQYPVSVETGPWSGRLYVAQDAALRMQQQLADPKQQGVLRFRLRPNGEIVPLGLTFRPRPPEPVRP